MNALVSEPTFSTRLLRLLLLVLVILALAIGANAEAAFAGGSRVTPIQVGIDECGSDECVPTPETTRNLARVTAPLTVERMRFLEANLFLPEAVDLQGATLCYIGSPFA